MARSGYEYGTSPKKTEQIRQRRKSTREKTKEKEALEKELKKVKEKEAREKRKAKIAKRKQARTIAYICLGFAVLFAVSYRNSQIDENFRGAQKLKKELVAVQQDNERLRIDIENDINLNNIEKAAQELLGMQRLNNNQKIYIELPKEDYVSSSSEQIVQNEETGLKKLISNFKNLLDNI